MRPCRPRGRTDHHDTRRTVIVSWLVSAVNLDRSSWYTSDSYSELVGQCSEPGLAVERVSLTVFICQLAGEPVIMMGVFLAGCVLLLPLATECQFTQYVHDPLTASRTVQLRHYLTAGCLWCLISPRIHLVTIMAVWRSSIAMVLMNKVNLRRAWLVLGLVTVFGFDSRGRHFISVCNQPPRSTQPSTLRGTVKWVPAKGR